MSARPALLLITALLSMPAAAAQPEPRPLSQLDLRVWTTDHGLPHDTVLSLAQTADGMLWAGTWAGLARFNGFEFHVFDRDTMPAFDDNGVLTVVADGAAVFAGTRRGGLVRIAGTEITQLAPASGPIGGHVLALEPAADALWIGTEESGLYRWSSGRIDAYRDEFLHARTTVLALAEAPAGAILVATMEGAFEIDAARRSSRPLPLPPEASMSAVAGIATTADGTVWISNHAGVYERPPGGEWRRRYRGSATALRIDRDGSVWAGTPTRGALRFSGARVEHIGPDDGLPDSRVRATLQDFDGNYWLGGNGGLVGLQNLAFRAIGAREGLANVYTRSVLENTDGTVWVATAGGLYRLRGDVAERIGAEFSIDSLLALGRLPSGDLLLGTYYAGLTALGADGRPRALPGLTLPGPQVRALLTARDGTLWVGSQAGLLQYDPATQRMLPLPSGAPTSMVIVLHEDASGNLWVGTSSGLYWRRHGEAQFVKLDATGGYPADATFTFLDDGPDALLLGTDAGLVRYTRGTWTRMGREHGLPFHSVLALLRDAGGNLWLGADGGVLRIARRTANDFFAGRTSRIEFQRFGRDEGMPSQQVNGSSGPNALRRANGELWFATARGIAVIDPSVVDAAPTAPPPVAISRALIDDVEVDPSRPHSLGPGSHTIQVNFVATTLARQSQVEYAYRVRGLGEEWRALGHERSLRLAALMPGEYRLEIGARFRRGPLSSDPAVLHFSIAPYLWQRVWFFPALLGLCMLAAFAVFRWRTAALRAREVQLTRRVAEQTAALEIKMQGLAERNAEKAQLLAELRKASAELERLAREDGLTAVANRRHFDQRFGEMFNSARNAGSALAVALLDIDHFKRINDRYSHLVGDLVLQRFAAIVRESVNDALIARYGGEEFVIALPGRDLSAARAEAEALRAAVAAAPWHELADGLAVTSSIGVAALADHPHPDRLLAEADERLYAAKRGGRNQVV